MPSCASSTVGTGSCKNSADFQKLEYAYEKLSDRYEDMKKERYNLSIKMNNKFKSVYGSTGAGTAQLWIRKVSS
ncbi:unnamed protein product [Ambrosiozyma monospora]|uniref:Unnamed protein product n=1 Tax=Ambrosiozyma monospora TaxID=43982 RepID=A0A9W6T187_AMBMO|nr:unnamed protein product [Ambrosiozyma monospora]